MAEIERQLAKMEDSIRRDKAPRLYSEHNLGFEIIESDDDEERAVGVRVFQVGENVIYAPIFFSGGELLGEELMWLKDQDLFVPFEDAWITYVQSREDLRLGLPGVMDEPPSVPSLAPFFEEPRSTGGFGSGSVKSSALTASARKAAQPLKITLKQAYLDADEPARRAFRDFLDRDHKVAEHLINKFDLCDTLVNNPDTPALFQPREKQATQTKVATYLYEARTPEQKEKILRDGYAVVKEAQSPKTQLVEDAEQHLVQPGEIGFFRVYTEEGPEEMLLVPASREAFENTPRRARFKCVRWDSKKYSRTSKTSDDLIAINENRPGHWDEQYEEAPDDTPTPGNTYVALGPDRGAVAGCFEVHEVVKLPNGHTKLKTRGGPNAIITSSPSGKRSTLGDGTVLIPNNWKLVEITTRGYDEVDDLITRDELLFGQANELRIKNASVGWLIETDTQRTHVKNRGEAIKALMEKHAFSEDAAHTIFERRTDGRTRFLYKQAQPPGLPISGLPPSPVPQSAGLGGAPPMNPQLAQMAGAGLQRGEDEAVETAALSSLLSQSDDEALLRKYLGDILTATDRYGRYLFHMYWNHDDFVDEFGATDLDELINNIITAFKLSGKIVLDLKQRLSGPSDLPLFSEA